MAEKAAHWVDRVIPHVATRQFALTVPWKRRWLLARRPALAGGVLRVALRCIERFYCSATGRRDGRCGAVTAIQRFGSALNLNLHFHIVHLDGVYSRGGRGSLRFLQAPPSTSDVEALVVEIGEACERWLAGQGFAGDAQQGPLLQPRLDRVRVVELRLLRRPRATDPRPSHARLGRSGLRRAGSEPVSMRAELVPPVGAVRFTVKASKPGVAVWCGWRGVGVVGLGRGPPHLLNLAFFFGTPLAFFLFFF